MTIKSLIADVTAVSSDLANSVGRWASGTFTSAGVSWTGTAAFTVLMAIMNITAAAATGVAYMGSSASATAILAVNATTARTVGNFGGSATESLGLKTGSNTSWTEIAAGNKVVISAQACAGKYAFFYIETPT
jgi:hypothetical protein